MSPAPRADEVKDRYRVVQVGPVTVHEGVQFPSEYLEKLHSEIGKELSRQKDFEEVVTPGQSPTKAGTPILRISEEITSYDPGSRAKRYFGGFGAGSTIVNARIVFMDGDSGRQFMAEGLRAILSGGLLGGSSEGVVQDFARQIVTKTKLMLAKRLPGPEETVLSAEPASTPEGTAPADVERHTIGLPGADWKDTEQKINEESASGFRVKGIDLIGKNKAQAVLEKVSSSSEHYEYRLVHTIRIGTLEKEMNQAGSQGFRMTKETAAVVGSGIALIMEKSPIVASEHYEYRVNQAVRISSSQKNTEKNEGNGYELVAEIDNGTHVLIFEKSSAGN